MSNSGQVGSWNNTILSILVVNVNLNPGLKENGSTQTLITRLGSDRFGGSHYKLPILDSSTRSLEIGMGKWFQNSPTFQTPPRVTDDQTHG